MRALRSSRAGGSGRRLSFVASFAVVALVLAGGLMLVGSLIGGWFGSTVTRERSAPVVLTELQDLARYRAATGEFSQIVDLEKDVKWVPSFLAGERTVLVAVGSVDAEVDFGALTTEHVTVSEDRTRVEIHLPRAELTEPRLDHDETHVATRSRGLANRVGDALSSNARDDQELLRLATDHIREAATRTELVSRAEANTQAMLTQLLEALGFTEVVIVFDDGPPV